MSDESDSSSVDYQEIKKHALMKSPSHSAKKSSQIFSYRTDGPAVPRSFLMAKQVPKTINELLDTVELSHLSKELKKQKIGLPQLAVMDLQELTDLVGEDAAILIIPWIKPLRDSQNVPDSESEDDASPEQPTPRSRSSTRNAKSPVQSPKSSKASASGSKSPVAASDKSPAASPSKRRSAPAIVESDTENELDEKHSQKQQQSLQQQQQQEEQQQSTPSARVSKRHKAAAHSPDTEVASVPAATHKRSSRSDRGQH